jgi:hypothetical protein
MVIILLMMTTIGLKAQSEKFYVNESEITKGGAIVYNKCYVSPVRITQKKDFIEIKTDSTVFHSYILKDNKLTRAHIVRSLLAAKKEQVFFVREFRHENKYYLIVIPIKLQNFHQNLGGDGIKLIISNVEFVCDSVKFVNK